MERKKDWESELEKIRQRKEAYAMKLMRKMKMEVRKQKERKSVQACKRMITIDEDE